MVSYQGKGLMIQSYKSLILFQINRYLKTKAIVHSTTSDAITSETMATLQNVESILEDLQNLISPRKSPEYDNNKIKANIEGKLADSTDLIQYRKTLNEWFGLLVEEFPYWGLFPKSRGLLFSPRLYAMLEERMKRRQEKKEAESLEEGEILEEE